MDVGQLRHRLTFQKPTEARVDSGGFATTYPEKDWLTVWAAVWGLKDKEEDEARRIAGKRIRRIRIRYRSGLTDKWRIYWAKKGIYLNIKSIIDVSERHIYLDIMAEETV